MDIKLDSQGDLELSENLDLQLVGEADAIAQNLKLRLNTFLGEWFLDTTIGIPFFRDVMKKGYDKGVVTNIFKDVIRQTEGVTDIVNFSFEVDSERNAVINCKALTDGGTAIVLSDFSIGVTRPAAPVFDPYLTANASSGLTNSVYKYISATNPFDGSSSMAVYFTAIIKNKTATTWPSGNNFVINKGNTATTRGYTVRLLNAGAPYICLETANGSGVLKRSPLASYASRSVGDLVIFAGTLSGGYVRAFSFGNEVGSGTACTGYTPPIDSEHLWVHGPATLFNKDLALLGFGISPSIAPTATQIKEWTARIYIQNDGFTPMGLAGESTWRASDIPSAGNWTDDGGTHTLIEQAATLSELYARTW